jgi:pimeloyl-ACP methyl ester carboxylesterase
MLNVFILFVGIFFSYSSWAGEVNFKTQDNATIYANYQQRGNHAVLLAHGAIFDKHSWGEFEQRLLKENYSVLAIDFRGYNKSTVGENPSDLYKDILAGVHFLSNKQNIDKVTVLGASMGAIAASKADVHAKEGEIDQLVLLSPPQVYKPEKLKGQVLLIASKEENLTKSLESSFKKVSSSKKLELIPGNAHAQHIFKTKQAGVLSDIIFDFLK